jgi:hypothetical protein
MVELGHALCVMRMSVDSFYEPTWRRYVLGLVTVALLALAGTSHATTAYDAFGDFSTSTNGAPSMK